MKHCPQCGASAPPEANFCLKCGAPLAGAAAPEAPAAPPPAEGPEDMIFAGRPQLIASLTDLVLGILTLGIHLVIRYFRASTLHVKITSQRLEVEQGLLSKRRDVLWLYRVEDLTLDQPFLQRLVGTGNLEVISGDKTTPDLVLKGIPDATRVYERLKACVERERSRRRTQVLDVQQ